MVGPQADTSLPAKVPGNYIPKNPVALAASPRVQEVEVVPLTAWEARRVLDAAAGVRSGAAFTVGLSLGLRCGEVLGCQWDDLDLDAGTVRVRRQLQRHPLRHECDGGSPCGRTAKSCPERTGGLRLVTVKSRAGRRAMGLPGPPTIELRRHHRAATGADGGRVTLTARSEQDGGRPAVHAAGRSGGRPDAQRPGRA
jgi:integrase